MRSKSKDGRGLDLFIFFFSEENSKTFHILKEKMGVTHENLAHNLKYVLLGESVNLAIFAHNYKRRPFC